MSTETYVGTDDGWKSLLDGHVVGQPPSGSPLFPGHQPGRQYVGANNNNLLGGIALKRDYFQWGQDSYEDSEINDSHNNNRFPWVSFKPPGGGAGGWNPVASGDYDSDIRAKARRYASYSKPVLTTFHHEPVGDGPYSEWVPAFLHILDVMLDETGDLGLTTYCPIINGYFFADWYNENTDSRGSPWDWITDEVAERCPLIGWDVYRQTDELQDWLVANRANTKIQSIAVAEYGRGPAAGGDGGTPWPNQTQQWQDQLDMYYDNRDLIVGTAFFNSGCQYFGNTSTHYGTGIPTELNIWKNYRDDSCWLSDLGY